MSPIQLPLPLHQVVVQDEHVAQYLADPDLRSLAQQVTRPPLSLLRYIYTYIHVYPLTLHTPTYGTYLALNTSFGFA